MHAPVARTADGRELQTAGSRRQQADGRGQPESRGNVTGCDVAVPHAGRNRPKFSACTPFDESKSGKRPTSCRSHVTERPSGDRSEVPRQASVPSSSAQSTQSPITSRRVLASGVNVSSRDFSKSPSHPRTRRTVSSSALVRFTFSTSTRFEGFRNSCGK